MRVYKRCFDGEGKEHIEEIEVENICFFGGDPAESGILAEAQRLLSDCDMIITTGGYNEITEDDPRD